MFPDFISIDLMFPVLSEANMLSPLNAGIKFPRVFSPLNFILQSTEVFSLLVNETSGLGSSKSISSFPQNFIDSMEEHDERIITDNIEIYCF